MNEPKINPKEIRKAIAIATQAVLNLFEKRRVPREIGQLATLYIAAGVLHDIGATKQSFLEQASMVWEEHATRAKTGIQEKSNGNN
jgi:hypothetical protein